MIYVELHARSAFSFLEGASLPETLMRVCAEQGMPAMALLDCDGVYGAPRFHSAAKKHRLKAHIGAEVSIEGAGRLPLLVESRKGYQNLCRQITTAKLRTAKTEIAYSTFDEWKGHSEGLICLTGDENGPLAHALTAGGIDSGRRTIQQLISVFGRDYVYVELQRHASRSQKSRNIAAIELAREFCLPLLATNGVCYATPDEREIADVFACIRNGRTLDTAGRLLSRNSLRHIRSSEEMTRLFADLPEAIANTQELSSRLGFTLENLGYEFPSYPVPEGESMDSFLRKRTWEGAQHRYSPITEKVRAQLEKELALIIKLKLSGYFLIVWDIVRFCQQNDVLVQGRGSAANSAVCYSLGITAVDPIGMDLLFERFLSEERGEYPDIDLDLPSEDQRESVMRERVIQYVYKRYGKRGAAMTANVCTYRDRSAAREVGKVLGFDEDSLSKLSSHAGTWEWKGPDDTFDKHFKHSGLDSCHPKVAVYLDLCKRIQDLPRHLSQHSGGMVICQGQLDSVVPLEPATMENRVVLQWDKDDCAELDIIKVDLLGLGMLAVLKDSIGLIRDHYREEVDLAHLPQDCPDVYETIRRAKTVGMFQIESGAQMSSLPRNNPTRFYDLVTQVALIRPGPIVGEMTSPYLKRREGKEAVTYPHESLKPVLERTLGVPLFQEQLLKLAMIAANFSGGEAEELRRALGSKRSQERMREIEVKLRAGMTANNIAIKTQDQIVRFISSFALYGFPESHAASFALIAYASAFLKVRYLAAFTAALLNNWPMGFYHPATLVSDAKRKGLRVRYADVTRSQWDCSLEPGDDSPELRIGLRYVRGLQQHAAEELLHQREYSPFASVEDLARRVPQLSRNNLAMLARIGALNNLGDDAKLHRRDALWQVEKAVRQSGPLLKTITESDSKSPLRQMSVLERLIADYYGVGLTTGPHPVFYCREELRQRGVESAAELEKLRHGTEATTAGCIIVRQRPGTAKGFIFLMLEDETEISKVIVTPDLYEQNRLAVLKEKFVQVSGRIQNHGGLVHLKARSICPLNFGALSIPSRDFH